VRGDVEGAIEYLQNALRDTDKEIHEAVYHALEIVSQLLVQFGDPLAARAHLSLLASLTPRNEQRDALEILFRMLASPTIPLLLKQQFVMMRPPEDVVWRDACQAALGAAGLGFTIWTHSLDDGTEQSLSVAPFVMPDKEGGVAVGAGLKLVGW